jgi:anti-sigma factor RsiW
MNPILTCRDLTGFLDDYVAGVLSPRMRGEADRHLALCPRCVDYLVSYRETIRLGRSAFDCPDAALRDDIPKELVSAVLAAIDRERGA